MSDRTGKTHRYTTTLVLTWREGIDGADVRRQSRALAARLSERTDRIADVRMVVARDWRAREALTW